MAVLVRSRGRHDAASGERSAPTEARTDTNRYPRARSTLSTWVSMTYGGLVANRSHQRRATGSLPVRGPWTLRHRTGSRSRTPIALCLAVALVATACGGSADPAATDGSDDPAATDGDTPTELRLAVGGEPEEGFDPTLGWGEYGNPLFHSALLRRTVDLDIEEDLATDWSVSEDGLTWTVTLRDDITFTDGEPLTVDDVVYTYETARDAGGTVDLAVLDEAVAVDEQTVEFRLNRPWSTFPGQLATIGIVPEHLHGDDYGRDPVGTGPWVLERWDEGQQLIVTRNDDYHRDLPEFERLVFQFTGEDGTLASARAGELHVASVPLTFADQQVDGMTLVAAQSVDNRGISLPYLPETGETTEDGMPIGNDVTSDLAIRHAINVAIDRDALVEGVLGGFGTPAFTTADGQPWGAPDAAFEDGDVERAQRILADGGWEDLDGDGVVEKDGVRAEFSIVYRSTDSDRQGLAIAVAQQLAEIGIDVTPDGREGSESFTFAPHQPVLFGFGHHDASEVYRLYHGGDPDSPTRNHFDDAYVNEQLDLAMAAADPEEANEHFRLAAVGEGEQGYAGLQQASYAWFVNIDHTYLVDECLELGELQIEPHGHGFPITEGIERWRWSC